MTYQKHKNYLFNTNSQQLKASVPQITVAVTKINLMHFDHFTKTQRYNQNFPDLNYQ